MSLRPLRRILLPGRWLIGTYIFFIGADERDGTVMDW
jgi:hypothetical protein